MFLKLTYFLMLTTSVICYCNLKSALISFKRPTYDFSVQILDRVSQETDNHFVFAPLSTWLQLMTLAEGARGATQNEIWEVTRYHRMRCFRRKYREILNQMDEELSFLSKRSCVIIFNRLFDVKNTFKTEANKLNTTTVLTLNFNNPTTAADEANEVIALDMDGVITEGLKAEDFNLTVLLMTDTAYFKSEWKYPFNPIYTNAETFYSVNNEKQKVAMMSQTGYFNLTNVTFINAQVLELPLNTDRISLLIALPITGTVGDFFYKLKDIRLMTIFSLFKREGVKLVTVKLPRFKIQTELDNIPELVYDMGIKRIFYPELADFRGISNFRLHASIMKQIADIEVTEQGVRSSAVAELLISERSALDFIANRPFAYLIVDKKTEVILFAGAYSEPSMY